MSTLLAFGLGLVFDWLLLWLFILAYIGIQRAMQYVKRNRRKR